jgi:hypothetical protein
MYSFSKIPKLSFLHAPLPHLVPRNGSVRLAIKMTGVEYTIQRGGGTEVCIKTSTFSFAKTINIVIRKKKTGEGIAVSLWIQWEPA